MTPTNDRHEIAKLAAETASRVAQERSRTGKVTPAQAAAAVTKAYRTAIATLAKTITVKE